MEVMSPCSTAPQGHVHGVTSHSAPMSAQNRAACGAVSAAKREIKYTQCRRMWFNAELRQNILMQPYRTIAFVLSRSTGNVNTFPNKKVESGTYVLDEKGILWKTSLKEICLCSASFLREKNCLSRPTWRLFSSRFWEETLQLFQREKKRAIFRKMLILKHKFSVLTLESRTSIRKCTVKGRSGLFWLPTTSRLWWGILEAPCRSLCPQRRWAPLLPPLLDALSPRHALFWSRSFPLCSSSFPGVGRAGVAGPRPDRSAATADNEFADHESSRPQRSPHRLPAERGEPLGRDESCDWLPRPPRGGPANGEGAYKVRGCRRPGVRARRAAGGGVCGAVASVRDDPLLFVVCVHGVGGQNTLTPFLPSLASGERHSVVCTARPDGRGGCDRAMASTAGGRERGGPSFSGDLLGSGLVLTAAAVVWECLWSKTSGRTKFPMVRGLSRCSAVGCSG